MREKLDRLSNVLISRIALACGFRSGTARAVRCRRVKLAATGRLAPHRYHDLSAILERRPRCSRTSRYIRLHFSLMALLFVMASSSVLHAGYILNWNTTSANPSSGSPITVNLFLSESSPDTNLQLNGASGASYRIDLTGIGTLVTPVGNAGFDQVDVLSLGPNSYTVSQVSILGLTPVAPSADLLIGSFQINYSGAGNGTLTISAFGSGSDFAVYDNGFNAQILDSTIFAGATTYNFTFNSSAVPEPSSLLLGLAGAACIALRHHRRRKR